MTKPLSTCCGAEIPTCGDDSCVIQHDAKGLHPQPKGEGWRQSWKEYCNQYWQGVERGEIVLHVKEDFGYDFIQQTIDEAVEADRKIRKILENAIPMGTKQLPSAIGKVVPGPNENRTI